MGLLLLIVPWSTFWDRNMLLEASAHVYAWTRSEFVRGAVSGLGVLNLGAGLLELAAAWRSRSGAAAADTDSLVPRFDDRRGSA